MQNDTTASWSSTATEALSAIADRAQRSATPTLIVTGTGDRPGEGSTSRAQAGPLPAKRGEIGFQEPVATPPPDVATSSADPALPPRHPADRDVEAGSAPPAPPAEQTHTPADTASTRSGGSTRKLIALLRPKRTFYGIQSTTFLFFLAQLAALGGTIAGWVLLTTRLKVLSSKDSDESLFNSNSSQIFVHVAFGVACLMQLILLERRIFRMRGERYCAVHGGTLPTHRLRLRDGAVPGISIAPWNRPPLPTYAAALAQSGVGTGDVEDNIIAQPPPPAYGHTRGSQLLLSGFMRDSLRAEYRARVANAGSRPGSAAGSVRSSRPVSYVSQDEEWEERLDRMRAVRLEETLTRLEEARVRH